MQAGQNISAESLVERGRTPVLPGRLPILMAALLATALQPLTGMSQPGAPSTLCQNAARAAAGRSGVPVEVLEAIALVETGRMRRGRLEPWPWTVNMEGEGRWFASREEALAYAAAHHARGARSFDLGCFQLNYRWHGTAFPSLETMLDPQQGALYAARFLRQLYEETGDWVLAAGAYHSRNEPFAGRYRDRFRRILASLAGRGGAPRPAAAEPSAPGRDTPTGEQNPFPLLASLPGRPRLGSLVPLAAAAGRELLPLGSEK